MLKWIMTRVEHIKPIVKLDLKFWCQSQVTGAATTNVSEKVIFKSCSPFIDWYKREGVKLKEYNDSEAFIECSNDVYDIYENTEEYNPDKARKMLIIFDNDCCYA